MKLLILGGSGMVGHSLIKELSKKLSECGYKKSTNIDIEGTWTRRGYILDIYFSY